MQNMSRSLLSLSLHLWTALFSSAHRFLMGLKSIETEMAISEHGCVFLYIFLWIFMYMFGVIVLLENPPMTKSQRPSRDNQIFHPNFQVYLIHYAIDLKYKPCTTGRKTVVLLLVCIPYCRQTCLWCVWPNLKFWSHLTIALFQT